MQTRSLSFKTRRFLAWIVLSTMPFGATGAPFQCEGGRFSVEADNPDLAQQVCTSAEASLNTLRSCNIPLNRQITIELTDTLKPGCMGVYHCGKDRIELLRPDVMEEVRTKSGSLTFVEINTYFQSVLAHELAHAAYETVPCPFDNCLATNEYLAHTMQVMSLPPEDIATLEAQLDMQTNVPKDGINGFIYMMAPDAFLRKSWVHLQQRPDPCAYIEQIMEGRIYMDHERFE